MPDSIMTANIRDEIIEQVAVGNHIIQIGSIHGAIANVATREERYTLRLRSTPIVMLPRPLHKLLDRQQAVQEAIAALESGQSVEFHSPAGFGKTFLLRCLVHDYQATLPFRDGIICLSPLHPYVGDILQSMWEAFYESDIPYKPTNKQIRQQINDKQALIVLDEGKLIKHELEELMNAASSCTFLIASSTSRVKQRGRSMLLTGLCDNDALVLVEEELQRSLTREELPAARSLCIILEGNPMHLQLAIASMLFDGRSLAQVVSQLPTFAPSNYLIEQIVASLSKPQRNILALLAMMDGVGLQSEQVIAITQLPDALALLEGLHRRHLVQFDGRHSVNQTIIEGLPIELKVTAPQDLAIAYFINWAEHHRQQPKNLLLEIDAIAQILDVAVRANRWRDVLRLVKAVEGELALSRRWSLWEQVLQRGLQASQVEQNQVAEAWALHQLGTCALCLSENASAINYLTKAIQLRESLGDEMGLSATRHNLHLLKILTLEWTSSSVGDADTHKSEIFSERATNVETPLPLPLTEDSNDKLFSSQYLLTRMNIVVENALPPDKPDYKGVLLSPKGVITTGILAAGGLLTWFNWHGLTQVTSTPSTTPTATATRSPIAKGKPRSTESPSPIAEPTSTATATLSPIIESPLKVDPLLTPTVELHKPITNTKYKVNNHKKSKSKPKSAPVPTATPTPITELEQPASTPTPTFIGAPIPTIELEQPASTPTPTPTFTPTATTELEQPTSELTPTATTELEQPTSELTPSPTGVPTPTLIITPKAEATPTTTFTPTGIVVQTQR